jgi:hypothetical protein
VENVKAKKAEKDTTTQNVKTPEKPNANTKNKLFLYAYITQK